MDGLSKAEQIAAIEAMLVEMMPQMESVSWVRRKPTSNELVLFADFYRSLIAEAWLKDVEPHFQLERIIGITGLTEHEVNVYMEIGGWISLDRKVQTLPPDEQNQLWDTLNSLDALFDDETIHAEAVQAKASRDKEIEELNKLFNQDS